MKLKNIAPCVRFRKNPPARFFWLSLRQMQSRWWPLGQRKFAAAVSGVSLIALAGCNPPEWVTNPSDEITTQVESGIQESRQSAESQTTDSLTEVTPESWFGPRQPVRVKTGSPTIPQTLYQNIRIAYVETVRLREILRLIALKIGVPVSVREDVPAIEIAEIQWSGTAQEAFDYITATYGLNWRYAGNQVEVYFTDFATWLIFSPNVVTQWQASVGLSGSARSGDGGSNLQARDQVVVSMDTAEFWQEIEKSIANMLSTAGKVTINRVSGELTVVDVPQVLDRIDSWVIAKNQELATQVLMTIDLYEIDRSEEGSSGFNFAGFAQEAFGKSSGRIDFSSGESGNAFGLVFQHQENGTIDTADLTLKLENATGGARVSKLTSTVLRGINGQPVPVFFGDERSYLQRRDVVTEDGGTTIRLVPGQLQDGIALNVLPRVLPNTNQMMLNITMRTTVIKNITKFPENPSSDQPSIQLPELETRSILLPVLLRSGETLFVAGLDTVRTNDKRSSGILSRSKRLENRRSSLVMLITPRIIPPSTDFVAINNRIR